MPKKAMMPVEELVAAIDFPHHRVSLWRKWLATGAAPENKCGASFSRLCFYATKLRSLGMSDPDIQCMLSDLYWDAVEEHQLNQEAAAHNN
ncbi:MAG TPA: hypothetical protein VNZ64_05660 [Candidatus Acidoferrum sp.]|jgi:hypothetical protein|nr:hypothetical protein [Candidatus Acidoferrum sp.]